MGRITDYDRLDALSDDDAIVVETKEGTRHITKGALDAEYSLNPGKNIEISNKTINVVTSDEISENNDRPVTSNSLFHALKYKQNVLSPGEGIKIDNGTISIHIPEKYGVCRDIPSHSPVLERVGDAKGLVAETALGNNAVRNDFDSIYPWCDIKRCTLADDGAVTSYEGDPDFATDGSKGQVMVEIPVYWKAHYLNESGTKEYTYISREKADSRYFIPKRFIDKNGNVLNKIYIAAYAVTIDADGKAESRTGTEGPVIRDLETMKAYCEARGDGWHPYGIWDYEVIKDLFTVEFATLDTQSIMLGVQESSYTESVLCYSSAEMWSRDDTTGLT